MCKSIGFQFVYIHLSHPRSGQLPLSHCLATTGLGGRLLSDVKLVRNQKSWAWSIWTSLPWLVTECLSYNTQVSIDTKLAIYSSVETLFHYNYSLAILRYESMVKNHCKIKRQQISSKTPGIHEAWMDFLQAGVETCPLCHMMLQIHPVPKPQHMTFTKWKNASRVYNVYKIKRW